jgi:uncharacterized membrane protein (DUF485 family)
MRPVVRSFLEVAAVFGLLGWLYAAACAAFRPTLLSTPIAAAPPHMRRDTFGAGSFVVSLVATFALQVRSGSVFRRLAARPGVLDAALRTVVIFGLLTWAYVAVNSLTHPATIGRQFAHFTPTPTEGTVAVVCFAASAVSLFTLRLRGRPRVPDEPHRGGDGD